MWWRLWPFFYVRSGHPGFLPERDPTNNLLKGGWNPLLVHTGEGDHTLHIGQRITRRQPLTSSPTCIGASHELHTQERVRQRTDHLYRDSDHPALTSC